MSADPTIILWCIVDANILHIYMYLEFNVTPSAGPTWPLDLQHSLSISILDGEPWVDEGAVLLNEANGGTRW